MTETEIDNTVEKVLPIANLTLATLSGVLAYLIAGGILVNPFGTLVLIVALVVLYSLPPVQRVLRKGLRRYVVLVNR